MAETMTTDRAGGGRGAVAAEWTPPRGRLRWQLADGEAMVAALRARGETPAVFAKRHGLQEVRVQRWIARTDGRPPRRAARAAPATPTSAVAFAPVRVTAPAAATRGCDLEVVVGDAIVRVGRDVDDELLRRVVAALAGARC